MSASTILEHASVRAAAGAAVAGEYLTFGLGHERYGMGILDVQEIRSYEAPTRIAGAAPHVKGVTNLRGTIVPLVDLRELFGCPTDIQVTTVVVVVGVAGRTIGVIADNVHDVTELGADDIKPAPLCGPMSRHIRGVATRGEDMVVLVDMQSLLAAAVDSAPAMATES